MLAIVQRNLSCLQFLILSFLLQCSAESRTATTDSTKRNISCRRSGGGRSNDYLLGVVNLIPIAGLLDEL